MSQALQEEILAVVRSGDALTEAGFDALLRAAFAHQYACNEPYRRYCERRGATPATVHSWLEVPAVPTDAFKAAALVCGHPSRAEAVFRTSGTTSGPERRGTHYVPDLTLYHAALRAGFERHLRPDAAALRFLSLVPAAEEVPDSSLSHMVSRLMDEIALPGSDCFVSAGSGIRYDAMADALRAAAREGTPVCIPGTAFAFVHWLDEAVLRGDRFALPGGSRVMDTGGFKGRAREVGRAELYRMLAERLGIAPEWMVNEYGMTELGSQFYDGVAGTAAAEPDARLHAGPAWVRTRATDPETLAILPDGEVGVLRHWDLANLGSVSCIQTADLGITSPQGFRVLGRARGAEARGCSLAMDDLLSALRG